MLGPLFGIIIADYWLVRRGKIDVLALYTEDPTGAYHYRGGVNLHAVAAFIPAAALSLVIAFIPALHAVSPFAWFIGAGLGAAIQFVIADRTAALRGCVRRAHRRRVRADEIPSLPTCIDMTIRKTP